MSSFHCVPFIITCLIILFEGLEITLPVQVGLLSNISLHVTTSTQEIEGNKQATNMKRRPIVRSRYTRRRRKPN
jgi:hypothetical protein